MMGRKWLEATPEHERQGRLVRRERFLFRITSRKGQTTLTELI